MLRRTNESAAKVSAPTAGQLSLLWTLVRKHPWSIAAALFALLLSAGATLAIPYGFKQAIDQNFVRGAKTSELISSFTLLFSVSLSLACATALRMYTVSWLGERVITDLRKSVQRNLLSLSPQYYEDNRPSEIAARLTSDTASIAQTVSTIVSLALRNVIVGIGGIAYIFVLAPKLGLILLGSTPAIVIPIVLLGRRLSVLSHRAQAKNADIGALATESLGALRIVQAFNQEQRERARFDEVAENSFEAARARSLMTALLAAITIFLAFGVICLVMGEGAIEVASGRMTGGTIAAFVFVGALVVNAIGALTDVYGELIRGLTATKRLHELLMAQPDIRAPISPQPLPISVQGALAFEQVEFHYPSKPGLAVLDGLDMKIRPGETVAIVGPSGAGKSTIFQLAQRFYDPSAGVIRMDGVPLARADPSAVRERISVVPQETVIFATSARDNLRYGNWNADDEQIWAAAQAANAADFLADLPDGLDTYLGEGGSRLSGGQRQRIALARAILRDAPILLLDEATSSLDAESEHAVHDAFQRLFRRRTTIVIAHRLATVRAADRILVLDKGRVIQEGRHSDLVQQPGLYSRLASLQFQEDAGQSAKTGSGPC